MKRFHISISVEDFAASVADYSARLGTRPCVISDNRYALWRTSQLNFSISRKSGQPAGQVRHIGFEDDAETGFREEKDTNGILWEYFNKSGQEAEIKEKIPNPVFVSASAKKRHKDHADISYRLLSLADVDTFHATRLRAVGEEPAAFLETYEEVKTLANGPATRYFENGWIAGAFRGDKLVGISGLYRHKGVKIAHKGTVWGVYVAPEARGKNVGYRLIEMLLAEAKRAGIEVAMLSANAQNPIAVALYESLGFEPTGMEKRILKLPDGYIDDIVMTKFL